MHTWDFWDLTKAPALTKVGGDHRVLRRAAAIRGEKRFQPALMLAVSFAAAILLGTLFLLLPACTVGGRISWMDALFTATSAVCVTGLTVQDTAAFFTPLGQAVILGLIQVGGLGILTFSTLILLVSGKRISLTDRIIIQRGFHHSGALDVKSLIKSIFIFALIFEGIGAGLLLLHWRRSFSLGQGLWHSVFHAVSAFCNAGFALFSDSFAAYRSDLYVNAVLMALIVLGGLGFLVHLEGRKALAGWMRRERLHFSLHFRLVLIMTFLLTAMGFVLFLSTEWHHSLSGMSWSEKLIAALFQVVTARTAGFNTLDLSTLSLAAVSLLIILMFVGASPGSTGGGVKTSTVGVIFAFLRSKLAARDTVNIFRRTLPHGLVSRAYTVVTLGICMIALATFLVSLEQPSAGLDEILFEVFSAFGTVGLSLGLTPKLRLLGKLVIILTMYVGRIGPLSLLYAFSRSKARGQYEYAEEGVMIG